MTDPEREPQHEPGTPPKEIELKFLVSKEAVEALDVQNKYKGKKIVQGYLSITPTEETRIRKKGDDEYSWAWKSRTGQHKAERSEDERPITREEFERRWPETEGKRVYKTRYKIPLDGGLVVELDIYEGKNDGHFTAEVEFPDRAAADEFEALSWFGEEVTGREEYDNASIAEHGFPGAA